MERYFYEAVLTPNELGGYDARFPELDIITQGDDLTDAAFMAQDLLTLVVPPHSRTGNRSHLLAHSVMNVLKAQRSWASQHSLKRVTCLMRP